MYCVNCGVKLQGGASSCPLCGTPVWNPEQTTERRNYPSDLPKQHREANRSGAIIMTFLCTVAVIVILTVCFKVYGELRWGGYTVLGILLFYILFVLPLWFRYPPYEVFVPVDHVAIALYVLYISIHTGGNWFLSFAFPVIGASCLLLAALVCLLKYTHHGRIFVFAGFLLLLGAFTMYVEFFEHISFGTQMFRWSLYSLIGIGGSGLFLLIVGIIPPLRHALEKRFFF